MKLKKIASLMLAGIMAVSMLAGCKDGASSSTPTNPIEPVDNSFATDVNAELSDAYKGLLSFSSDSDLTAAVNKIAASTEFTSVVSGAPVWVTQDGDVAKTFRELLNVDTGNKFTIDAFKNVTDKKTVADLLIFNGGLTESGLAKAVADEMEKWDSRSYFPLKNDAETYRYSYTGNIAVTEVTVMNGTASYYVVGFTITMTPTKVAA